MSKQNNTLTRRTFLKGAAYASALSAGSLSGVSLAKSVIPQQDKLSTSATGKPGLMAVTLSNQSDVMVALDARQPVSLEKVNDWVVVKVNKAKVDATEASAGQHVSLAAGQQCSFPVDAEVAPALNAGGAYIVITNEFSPLDNLVPVTHANAAFA